MRGTARLTKPEVNLPGFFFAFSFLLQSHPTVTHSIVDRLYFDYPKPDCQQPTHSMLGPTVCGILGGFAQAINLPRDTSI